MGRLLFAHFGGIGDFVLALPALKQLAFEGPVDLLGNKKRLEVAVAAGFSEMAYSADVVGFGGLYGTRSFVLERFMRAYDKAVIWLEDDGKISAGLNACGVREVACFPGVPPANWRRHASDYYLDCLGLVRSEGPALLLPGFRRPYLGADCILHPGSGSRKKNWSYGNFLKISAALREHGQSVRWCVGPAETAIELPEHEPVLQCESLIDLAHQLGSARLFIGNDSGITHLAAAVGCPTLALFGPTDPAMWRPLGPCVQVVYGQPWPDLRAVVSAALRLLP